MALTPGIKLGPYEIIAPLGAGGMGEVYRAHDKRLGRDVAIKVLPAHLMDNAEVRQRFEREARAASSLNHPHICTLHDVGHGGDIAYLVMELVEGETLAERIARGPLPASDVLKFGAQIADALDRAHRAGVIHRDLKPGNVMLTKSGAKLLDFGLARATGLAAPPNVSGTTMAPSPTIAGPLTAEGTMVGTFQYMAPEQLEGREADARSDLWALGCVLYEMATGRRAFDGGTQASVISAIMRDVPRPMAELAPLSPPALERLVGALLAKDPDERIQTAHDAKLQLQWATGGESGVRPGAAPAMASASLRGGRLAWTVAALALAAALTAWFLPVRPARETGRLRYTIEPPEGFVVPANSSAPAISPDARAVVLVVSDSSETGRLCLRGLGELEGRMLEGTEHALLPFWSPDGRWVAFFADGKLKRIPIAGGQPEVVCDAPDARGGSWGSRGTIVFAPIAAGPLMAVAQEGGAPTEVARPDSTRGETALRAPCFLPDGRHFLFVSLPQRAEGYDVHLAELGSSKRRVVLRTWASPVYAEPGYLVAVRGAQLIAQRFDARTGQVSGKAATIGVAPASLAYVGAPAVSVSRSGVLAYTSAGLINTRLEWWTREGRSLSVVPLPTGSWSPRGISPDGRQVLLQRASSFSETDIWRLDLANGQASRLTFAPTQVRGSSIWAPDGNSIAYGSSPVGPKQLFIQSTSGGPPRLLYGSVVALKNIYSWTPDGKFVLFEQPDPRTGWDVWAAPVEGDPVPIPIVRTPAGEGGGWISPDGRWLAFGSDESGRFELYVQAFPGPSEHVPVPGSSTSGNDGAGPCWWTRDGRELLFVAANSLRVAPVEAGATIRIGPSRLLCALPAGGLGVCPTPDHDRLLVAVPAVRAARAATVIDMNWAPEIQR